MAVHHCGGFSSIMGTIAPGVWSNQMLNTLCINHGLGGGNLWIDFTGTQVIFSVNHPVLGWREARLNLVPIVAPPLPPPLPPPPAGLGGFGAGVEAGGEGEGHGHGGLPIVDFLGNAAY